VSVCSGQIERELRWTIEGTVDCGCGWVASVEGISRFPHFGVRNVEISGLQVGKKLQKQAFLGKLRIRWPEC